MEYDPDKGTLNVKQPDGDVFNTYQLSTGTYNQLYFSTRLSLAYKILGGEKGFLLLDDPFLAADSIRLANQLDMLVDQVRDGWQIVYFTVKDGVFNYLRTEYEDEEFDYNETLGPVILLAFVLGVIDVLRFLAGKLTRKDPSVNRPVGAARPRGHPEAINMERPEHPPETLD
ncbi:MAG: hypothetical protein R6U51_09480 [Anaerolineales bacterium]